MKQNSPEAISSSESTAINYLRALAFLLILGDHFFVFLKVSHISSILVVGVQLFFVISGFLYGKREITDWKGFFVKRIKKVYVPFVVFLLFMFLVYWLLEPNVINGEKSIVYLLNLQGFDSINRLVGGGIPYLSHLWFITILFCCLFITPVLQWARRFGLWSIIVVTLLFAINLWHLHQTPLYILLYALAYFLASSSSRIKKYYALFSIICCLVCIPFLTWHDMDLFTWPSMLIKSAFALAALFILQSVFHHYDITKQIAYQG